LIRRLLQGESGYSLVEVMASIMILAIAIIPMVGMFDMGLNTATSGSHYDKARAFLNERLERTKVLPYESVRDGFPVASSTPSEAASPAGSYTSSAIAVPASAKLPAGSTYTVVKQYVKLDQTTSPATLVNSNTDKDMIRVTVTVNWSGGKTISASSVVAGGVE
jgi:prepilin-type N-terminal cleavage/methylation domain-containing protein